MRSRLKFLTVAGALLLIVAAPAVAAAPNVVLISIDTLRADHLHSYGYPAVTSPFIDSLAAKGLLFEEAVTPLPSTTPSHGSMLTSLYPPRHGSTTLSFPISRNVETLATVFRKNGYYTAGSVGVHHLGPEYNFERGFADFGAPVSPQRNAGAVNADAFRFMNRYTPSPGRPYFLWVHYFDCHSPYGWWRPGEEPPKDDGVPRAELIRRYDASIRHVDDELRKLYSYLQARGLDANTVFCITSDHGEQIGDHGLAVGHAGIYRETVRVPLLFAGPAVPPGRSKRLVSTLDIAASLLGMAGLKFEGKVDGASIISSDGLVSRLLSGWLGHELERDFVVTGNPGYTRSVELVRGRYWFIRNFDYLYQASFQEGVTEAGNVLKRDPRNLAGSAAYIIPARSYVPYVMNVSYVPVSGSCEAEISADLPSGVHYFTLPKRGWKPMVLRIPGARLDVLTITIKPSACVREVRWTMTRMDTSAPLVPAGATPVGRMFLYAERQKGAGDELYDTETDPRMVHNRIGDRGLRGLRVAMERELQRLYTTVVMSPDAVFRQQSPVRDEELQKLRSLGYLF